MTTLQQESEVIQALKQKVQEKNTRLMELQGKLQEARKELEEFKKQSPDSSGQIKSRESRIGSIEQEIQKLQNTLENSTNSLSQKVEQAERIERAGFRQAKINPKWWTGLIESPKQPGWLNIYTKGTILFIIALLPLAILLPLFLVGDPYDSGRNEVVAVMCSLFGWPFISAVLFSIFYEVYNAVFPPCPVFKSMISHSQLALAHEVGHTVPLDFVFIASPRREDFVAGFTQPVSEEASSEPPKILGVLMLEPNLRFFGGCKPKQLKDISDAFFYEIDKEST